MQHGRAFFLSPQGKLIRVETSHIGEVLRHPEEFGLTLEEIERAYQKHGEKIGMEGKAREEILSRIVAKGWIRIREYPDSHWSFTLRRLTSQEKGYLQDFAQQVLSRKGAFADAGERRPDPHLAVTVSTPSWDLLSMTDLAALASEGIPLGARNRGADARGSDAAPFVFARAPHEGK